MTAPVSLLFASRQHHHRYGASAGFDTLFSPRLFASRRLTEIIKARHNPRSRRSSNFRDLYADSGGLTDVG
jgi:hypothetical protein